jgi:hypothetical protein
MSNKMLDKYYGNKPNMLYHSKNKSLSVYLTNKCSTVKASGHYYFLKNQSRLQGFLARENCHQDINSEKLEFDFTDIEGDEICRGKMTRIESAQKNVTIWKIEGSVSGHYCSQVGKIIEVEMEKGAKAR